MPLPTIHPPLVNSANPWATTIEDLQALFDCQHTGAVTTRTSLLRGFAHKAEIHQYEFFDPVTHDIQPPELYSKYGGSLNTLGYSPISLSTYLSTIEKVISSSSLSGDIGTQKPFIISVTGSAEDVCECYQMIRATQARLLNPLCMEVNLSCPNIPDKPPPAYSDSALEEYLDLLAFDSPTPEHGRVPIGIKTPPYTYHGQFQTLVNALLRSCKPTCPIDFITATNTLGSSLVLQDTTGTSLLNSASGTGIGGMAGAPLHPLALGNVKTLRDMLNRHEELRSIDIIGVGGVGDGQAFDRMRAVGAKVVGVGTALGMEGIDCFSKILGTSSERRKSS